MTGDKQMQHDGKRGSEPKPEDSKWMNIHTKSKFSKVGMV